VYTLKDVCEWFQLKINDKKESKNKAKNFETTAVSVISYLVDSTPTLQSRVKVIYTEIDRYKYIEIPSISSAIKPDKSVCSNDSAGDYVFFAEVLSSKDEVSTARNLFFNCLILQLIYIQNSRKDMLSISVVLLPTTEKKCKLLEATLTWNPEKFKFVTNFKAFTKDTIAKKLLEVIKAQIQYLEDVHAPSNHPILSVMPMKVTQRKILT